jgi:phospholipid/cholesterol/gamma-HCH transport system ATP-binding protein
MVTHDLDSLASACDRIAALADRRVVAVGRLADLMASPHPWVASYFRGERARARMGATMADDAAAGPLPDPAR